MNTAPKGSMPPIGIEKKWAAYTKLALESAWGLIGLHWIFNCRLIVAKVTVGTEILNHKRTEANIVSKGTTSAEFFHSGALRIKKMQKVMPGNKNVVSACSSYVLCS